MRRRVKSGAFALRTVADGAALVWADAETGALSFALFDREGVEHAVRPLLAEPSRADAEPSATRGSVEELAAAARGNELGVVWIERSGNELRTLGAVRALQGEARDQPSDLGSVAPPLAAPRGNLAIAVTRDGDFLALSRGMKADCIRTNESECIAFSFHYLTSRGVKQRGVPLIVPKPCERSAVVFATLGDRWHYGICSRNSGKSVTTLFAIQPEPAYARADPVLEGCFPAGAFGFEGDLLLTGDCATERRGVRVTGPNAEFRDVSLSYVDATCKASHLVVRGPGAAGLKLTFAGPQDELEAILPRSLVPLSGRAVWTGRALLVAAAANGELELRRYRCDSSLLRPIE